MLHQPIATINGVGIVTVEHDGEIFVPIKPICDALGIDVDSQRNKLNSDEFFNSTTAIIAVVAADEKTREMYCIRLRDVYGWLATINPGKVAPEAREVVTRYRRECYDVLYEHFTGSMKRIIETNNAEIELLQNINAAITEEKEARIRRRKAEEALGKLRAERLSPQPNLFD